MKKLIFILTFLLGGCTFTLEDEYYKEIEQNVIVDPTLIVDLNLTDDTLFVEERLDLTFNADIGSKELLMLEYYLDDSLQSTAYETTFNTRFSVEYLDSGLHHISFKIYTRSGTGSLADKVGAEYLMAEVGPWVIYVNNNVPPSSRILTYGSEEGVFTAYFEPYIKYGFEEYRVYKGRDLIATIIDYRQNWFEDPTHIGKFTNYRVDTKTVNRYSTGVDRNIQAETVEFLDDYEVLSDTTVLIKWMRSVYYPGVSHYEIFTNGQLVYQTEDALTTSAVVPVLFGQPTGFDLSVISKTNPDYQSRVHSEKGLIVEVTQTQANYRDWSFWMNNESIYLSFQKEPDWNGKYIINIYDPNGNTVGDLTRSYLSFNQESVFEAFSQGVYFYDIGTMERSGQKLKSECLNKWPGGGNQYFFGDVYAGDSHMAIKLKSTPFETGLFRGYAIFDMNNCEVLDSLITSEHTYKDRLDAYSEYYLINESVYSYKDGIKTFLGTISGKSFSRLEFIEKDNEIYLREYFSSGDNTVISYYQIPSLNLVGKNTFPGHIDGFRFDPVHFNFFIESNNGVTVYDFESASVIQEVQTNGLMELMDGKLICRSCETKLAIY